MKLAAITWGSDMALLINACKELGVELNAWSTYDVEEEKKENIQQQQQQKQQKKEKEEQKQQHEAEQPDKNPEGPDDNDDVNEPQNESVFNIGDPIDTRAVRQKQKKDKTYRRKTSGRRIPTLSLRSNGKYIRHGIPKGKITDVTLDATIRAAAVYQKKREVDSNLAAVIKSRDIREKIRVGKISTATMFVVDASGSMGANRRMESAKGAVLSLLLDSYQQRDKVGMVAFKGDQADVLLPLCRSSDLAVERLKELPTGGRTPLAAGLEQGLNLLIAEKHRDEEAIPILLLISDGRANVSAGGSKELEQELLALAEQARAKGIYVIVIDTEIVSDSFIQMQLGYCRAIASYSGGKYYPIADLTSGAVRDIVIRERNMLNLCKSV